MFSSLIVLLFASFSQSALAACPALELPTRFEIKEHFFSALSNFTISSQNGEAGVIEQRVFNWGKTFEIYNSKHERVAYTRQELVSWGVKINVFDCDGVKIGALHEEVMQSLIRWSSRYTILDAAGKILGQSDKSELASVNFEMRDQEGHSSATMAKGWPQWPVQKWEITIFDASVIPPALLLAVPVYKTSAERSR